MQHDVEINIEADGVRVCNAATQRVCVAIPCRAAALLILAANVAPIEHAVTVAPVASSSLRLADRRQLDGGEPDGAQDSNLTREEVV